MLTPDQFFAFLAAAILLTLSPGPDNMMVLSVGVSKGRARGIAFGLGCAFGCLSHTLLAVVGVSALIAASPLAFTTLKVCGGLYLAWMGWHAIRSKGGARIDTAGASADPARTLFVKGLVANAINPKVALFFLSFLPQFVPHGAPQLPAMVGLAAAWAVYEVGYYGCYVLFVHRMKSVFGRAAVRRGMERISGGVLLALGLRLALEG